MFVLFVSGVVGACRPAGTVALLASLPKPRIAGLGLPVDDAKHATTRHLVVPSSDIARSKLFIRLADWNECLW